MEPDIITFSWKKRYAFFLRYFFSIPCPFVCVGCVNTFHLFEYFSHEKSAGFWFGIMINDFLFIFFPSLSFFYLSVYLEKVVIYFPLHALDYTRRDCHLCYCFNARYFILSKKKGNKIFPIFPSLRSRKKSLLLRQSPSSFAIILLMLLSLL